MKKYIMIISVLIFAVVSIVFANNGSKSIEENSIKEVSYKNAKTAYFAGGCFWGVEYHLEKQKGVYDVSSGFMGGSVEKPSYYDVVRGKTGHLESVKVIYDSSKTTYEELSKVFFEIHDMEQTDGQGPDIGEQYLSAIFYNNNEEKEIANNLIKILTKKGFKVATSIIKSSTFYEAEAYHQNYYKRKGSLPYCHTYKKIF